MTAPTVNPNTVAHIAATLMNGVDNLTPDSELMLVRSLQGAKYRTERLKKLCALALDLVLLSRVVIGEHETTAKET